ncbi:hypothetical protein BXZ70DRAFT_117463 [Cristinia sonorae]|uniref:Ubiquitin 3 binding protein But2 C-terminal domain-containing protein n=1 Tax=Cristinia sonorae TaxID=1940300 RepID=A0A8K0XQF1_9AGAR|nr:hypothetical protein BXZ70DRAFT_117463 [Cristinia sonorae]
MSSEESKSLLRSSDTDEANDSCPKERAKSRSKSRSTAFYIFVAVLCTCLNVYAFRLARKLRTHAEHYTDYGRLKRPNPFVGLDHLPPPKDAHTITIFPVEISQINSAAPGRAYSEDPARLAEIGGLIAPGEKEVKITSKVSTIFQFRTVDFRMENCELAVSIPNFTNFTLSPGENLVDIWTSAADAPLDVKKLTWETRPARKAKIQTISMTHGINYNYSFPCPADNIFVFEFSAGSTSTEAKWVQNYYSTSGVVLYQHPSFSS